MAITFPRSLPNLTDVLSIGPGHMSKVGLSESEFTFESQVQKFKGQRWSVKYTLVPMPRDKAFVWTAWLASLNGRENNFLSPLTHLTTSLGTASTFSNPQVAGAGQTGNTLAIDNAPVSETNYFKAGDYLQLGASGANARIYMVLQDASTDGSGEVTVDIWPDLYTSPTNSATITVSNPRGLFKLINNIAEYTITNARTFIQLRFSAFGVI